MRNEQRYDEALVILFIVETRKHLYGETHPRTLVFTTVLFV